MKRAVLTLAALAWAGAAVGAEFFTLKGHGGPVMGVAVSLDTGQVATAGFDNAVGLWTGSDPQWFDGHEAAVKVVVLDGDDRLVSGGDDFRVLSWDASSATPTELHRHKGKVSGLAIGSDGLVASASWDGTIALIPRDGETRVLTGHNSGVNAVLFSPDGSTIFSAGADGTIRLWSLKDGNQTRTLLRHGFGVNALVAPKDGRWIGYGTVDGHTKIVDPATGEILGDFTLDRRPILSMSLHEPSGQLAVGDGDGFIMVIDTNTWRIARDFRATLRGPIWALAFSPDGQSLYAGGLDHSLYAWPVATLSEHAQMAGEEPSFLRDPSEMGNGERQFARKCSICHSTSPGSARKAGPTLHGVFGRRAGTVTDYSYSSTLDGSDIVWSESTIDALFDEGPDNYIPGSKMPMQRIAAPEDRADLVEYLKQVTQ